MPWSKDDPPTKLLKDKEKTKRKFKLMIDKLELPSSVISQYICAMKYQKQKKLEITAAKGTEQPFNLEDMDEEERERYIAHQHASHFSDNKVLNDEINGMTVDIGTNIDWSISKFTEPRKKVEEGMDWAHTVKDLQEEAMQKQASSKGNLVIPRQKDGKKYSVE